MVMREFIPQYPLEYLHHIDPLLYWRYQNLLRDEKGRIISENITYFKTDRKNLNQEVNKLESMIKEYCPNTELVYHDVSGNRWIFLLYIGNLSKNGLNLVQQAYEKLYNSTAS
jgi:hypothetical protein